MFDHFNLVDTVIFKKNKSNTRRNWDSIITKRGLYGGDGGGGGGGGGAGTCSASGTTGCGPGANGGGGDFGIQTGGYAVPQYFYITGQSGIYSGSLSAQGNMLAMQINPGKFRYADGAGNFIGNLQTYTGTGPINCVPYLRGCMREYWRDPTQCTFGSNSAIPALTGVMPTEFTTTQGNFNYYVDLQIQRLFGTNGFDQFFFYNALYQLIGWVTTSNSYLAGLKNSENTNLAYYGFKSYDDLVTQGFNKYKNSRALVKSFTNLGLLVETISLGYFGTSNAVAKSMIDHGLGIIGNLSEKLFNAGIIYQQLGNPNATATINEILKSITNPVDLQVIQSTLKTTVDPDNFTSPLAYTSIESTSGLANDSQFKNLGEVGLDIYLRAPGSNFITGRQVALLIENIQNESNVSVESIGTVDSLLTPEIVATLRSFLPTADGNRPITMIDVIGTASGYLTTYMKEVNDAIAELYATDYGPQIRTLLEDLSRYAAGVPISKAEVDAAATYTPVPPPQYTVNSDGYPTLVPGTGGPGYWAVRFFGAADQYFALLRQIVADPKTSVIAKKINDNYTEACRLLNRENQNYIKANISTTPFSDNSQVFSFVSSIPELAVDRQNIATDYLLYGISQNNANGQLLRTILAQAKNSSFLSNAGAKITGVV